MSASAGRVLILLKGEYNSATSYQMLDAVHYHGSLYIAKKATLGNVPQDGEYWMLCASGATWGDIGGIITNQTDLMNLLNGKQNTLTFDTVPTASSTNPVTSAGIKTAVDAKITNPAGGSTGDVLRKTATGEAWTPETGSAWGSITGNIDSQTDLKTKLDASASNIATIESTAFASKAYVEGEFLTYNGQLYEVIAAIALGEALVIGTNIEATSVGEELTTLNNGLASLDNNPVILWKTSTRSNISHPTGGNYWTMPDAFPPKSGYSRYVVGVAVNDSTSSVLLSGAIRQDNTVIIRTRNEGSATVTISLTAIYIYLKDSAQF